MSSSVAAICSGSAQSMKQKSDSASQDFLCRGLILI
jgi:hypothetical protein